MRRREFMAALAGVATWPLASLSQQTRRLPTVGVLALGVPPPFFYFQSFLQGLHDLGWIDGQTVTIEFRWAATVELLPNAAAELVAMDVDVIFANSSTYVEPASRATKTIPIVFADHADPIGVGHVASLARPGGNITGISMLMTELAAKQLRILKETIVGLARLGVLWNPATPSHQPALKSIDTAARHLGIQPIFVAARVADGFDLAMTTMKQLKADAFLDVASPLTFIHRTRLAESALKFGLPGVFGYRQSVEAGGLMSYGADNSDLFRRAAAYVDKILKGDKPADLPVEQASKYELVINIKTATALALTIPTTLLARADEVIE